MDLGAANVPVAAKLPAGLASELALYCAGRGISQSAFIRILVERTMDGTTPAPTDAEVDERERIRTQAKLRDYLHRQVSSTRALSASAKPHVPSSLEPGI